MLDLEKVEYTTRPLNLGDRIFAMRAIKNQDHEALMMYILRRTNITETEVLELLDEECTQVVTGISKALDQSNVLQQIAKAFDAI